MKNNIYTLITGAGEGLGKAMAIECARRKMNLILVALPGPEIFFVSDFIMRNYGVDVIGIEKDLCGDESCAELFEEVSAMNVQINMLINNAGIGSTILFGDGCITLYEKQIKLNVLATTLITRLFLNMLKRNSPAYIMNVGSMASFFCLPKKNVYGATKSFIYVFSKSLRKELKKDKIHVCVLCPGGMNTNRELIQMNKTGNYISRLSVMNPENVGQVAIDGMLKKKEVIIPGKLNQFFMLLDMILPGFIKRFVTDLSMKKMNTDKTLISYMPEAAAIHGSASVA